MRLTIFYFDDDERLLDVFREMFSDTYEVLTAATLADARKVLSGCAPDFIISDQLMPEIQGTEFLREAAAICPESFRVLLTGHATLGEVIYEVTAGVVHLFEVKPWREERMREILERAATMLDRRRT